MFIYGRSIHKMVRSYKCRHCDKSFSYAVSLKSHMVTHAAITGERLTQLMCNLCNKGFLHQSSLTYHKETAHNTVESNGLHFRLMLGDIKGFTWSKANCMFFSNHCCHYLQHVPKYGYYSRTSLIVHERWHEGKKPFKCEICKKDFAQKGNLLEHQRTHTGEKPFCCDVCGRKFTTSSQFSFHRMRHTGVRPWSCSYCPRNFLIKAALDTHVRRHFNEKPVRCPEPLNVCPRCGKKFKDKSNYLKHTRRHDRADKMAEEGTGIEQHTGANSMDFNESIAVETPAIGDQSNDGLSIPIVTGNDENRVHGLLPDGTLVPIELNELEDKAVEEIVINNSNEEPSLEGPISILTEDIDTQPLDTNIQLMTNEHGQEMCLLTYSVNNVTNSEEINQSLTLESLLSSSNKVIGINKI
nr:unnamed protein product [Callosobruchus chinensis]